MSLYYQDDHVTLYHGDCLTEHTEWLTADALVSDVPYGIAYKSNQPRTTLARSIAGDKDTSARDNAIESWRNTKGDTAPALIFGTWKPAHQEIYVLGKGFAGKRGTDVLSYAPVQSLGYNGRVHPHQKPLDLMQALIGKCPPGTIADPFAGSGSTLVAARMVGRKSIGVELDEKYCEIIAKRFEQSVLDLGVLA